MLMEKLSDQGGDEETAALIGEAPVLQVGGAEPRELRFVFLLLPGFSNFSLQALREPLQQAQAYRGVSRGASRLVSLDGEPVKSGDGSICLVDCGPDEVEDFDYLVLCGGEHEPDIIPTKLGVWLRQAASRGKHIGAIESGCVLLARLGYLKGYRATAHWRFMSSLSEKFPHLQFESSLFEIDRDRFTCSGGVAGLDMMLELIAQEMSEDIATHCLNYFNQDRHRAGNEPQRVPGSPCTTGNNLKLKRAMAMIQNNLEEDLTAEELANMVGSSRRQLERLFRRFLGKSPMAYRQELRLWRARDLVMGTGMTITEVAFASGFSSNSHFSARFKMQFGMSPREARMTRENYEAA
ncbi:GlxA family transcriptional regulator [Aestuariispira insulae]|uniref:Transcriptional regulator GlxA family with amidase domain n=1 Tax=Aestuariispira insulae TaxID=1461337 RepID=A0A3D9HZ36_9PROT|nr:GlxA family transcriptional regulator [Aestuariispira insulae]RED54166.1 transcriptional regulator GlxA family with amidase domain [Aestuariispira insulae]